MKKSVFDSRCQRCDRLAQFLFDVKQDHPDYFCKPVPPFGDDKARLLIVGLAPGKHGANATGRPFTGDYAGVLLYQTLYDFGFSSAPESRHAKDGLKLLDCRITNAVKCLPPENKPTTEEVRSCNPFLSKEIAMMPKGSVLLALGSIAHNAVLRAEGEKLSQYKFGHGALHELPSGQRLLDSYHCSRYNTQTRRLTEEMFRDVFHQARSLLN
jgi:uracil-DNA glycosylase family 4